MQDILHENFLNNPVSNYLVAAVGIAIGILIVKIFQFFVLRRLKQWAEKTDTKLDDFVIHLFQSTLVPLFYYAVFYSSLQHLNLHPLLKRATEIIGLCLLTLFVMRLIIGLVEHSLQEYWRKRGAEQKSQQPMPQAILSLIKGILWGFGTVFILDNLGFKISTVVAGLGISGIAIALAAQAILGDIFSYFIILFDTPFELDDFIIVGDYMGNVEHIGIKTTRIRSLTGEQLVISNTDLTNSRIRNYKRMGKRRILFQFGVTYETPIEQLREIPQVVKEIIAAIPDVTLDRVHLASLADSSLNFEIVYHVLSGDYAKYMDIQQEINFKLLETFQNKGIDFAYPTQTLFLQKP